MGQWVTRRPTVLTHCQLCKYLDQRSFRSSTVQTQTDAHRTYCSTWATKMVGNEKQQVVKVI